MRVVIKPGDPGFYLRCGTGIALPEWAFETLDEVKKTAEHVLRTSLRDYAFAFARCEGQTKAVHGA